MKESHEKFHFTHSSLLGRSGTSSPDVSSAVAGKSALHCAADTSLLPFTSVGGGVHISNIQHLLVCPRWRPYKVEGNSRTHYSNGLLSKPGLVPSSSSKSLSGSDSFSWSGYFSPVEGSAVNGQG